MPLYFLRGSLPWQCLQAKSQQERYELVFERKKTISVTESCHGLPTEFATFMTYIREMDDQGSPDYKYLRNLSDGLFRSKGFDYDNVFDWTIREFERLSKMDQQPVVSRANDVESKTHRSRTGRRERKRTRKAKADAE